MLSRLVSNSQAELILLPQSSDYWGLKVHLPLPRPSPPESEAALMEALPASLIMYPASIPAPCCVSSEKHGPQLTELSVLSYCLAKQILFKSLALRFRIL